LIEEVAILSKIYLINL